MKKRILSALLTLGMVLTMLPVSVFATEPGDGSGMMRSCKTDMSQILGKVKTVCYFCLS